LKDNQDEAFTVGGLLKRLEDIINDANLREFVSKNLQGVLNRMQYKKKVLSTEHDNEKHYYISREFLQVMQTKLEEETEVEVERKAEIIQTPKFLSKDTKQARKKTLLLDRKKTVGILFVAGFLLGIIVYQVGYWYLYFLRFFGMPEIILSIIIISLLIIREIRTKSIASKEGSSYHLPIYGIISIVISIAGLIVILIFGQTNLWSFLYATPILIIAIFIALRGYYSLKDFKSDAALLGLFLASILFSVSLSPFISVLIFLLIH
jgi:hypothetical protein